MQLRIPRNEKEFSAWVSREQDTWDRGRVSLETSQGHEDGRSKHGLSGFHVHEVMLEQEEQS